MRSTSGVYLDEEGNKKLDVNVWDALIPVTQCKKMDGLVFVFKAATRDGVRYVNITEATINAKGELRYKKGGGISVPLYVPVNKGTEIIKPFLDFVRAFQETVEAHKDVPLEDPDTRVVITRTVKTRKENKEECNELETLEQEQA